MAELEIKFKQSKLLAYVFLIIHLGACISVFEMNFNVFVKILVFSICFVSFFRCLFVYAILESDSSICQIRLQDGKWELMKRNGEVKKSLLRKNSIVTPFFVLLNFRLVDARIKYVSIPLFSDSIDKNDFRHLRVELITNYEKYLFCDTKKADE